MFKGRSAAESEENAHYSRGSARDSLLSRNPSDSATNSFDPSERTRSSPAGTPCPAPVVLLQPHDRGVLPRRRRRVAVDPAAGRALLPLRRMNLTIRQARTPDVPAIRRLLDAYAAQGILLDKATVTLYEDVQEFWVAERGSDGAVVGCGALHVMWEDLAEVRTLAVDPESKGHAVGSRLLAKLLETARSLGVQRIFCLTFEVDFFARHGFTRLDATPVTPEVYEELLRSYDEGVAEFLDLDRVKPNTLGNTRMLLYL